MLRDARQNGEWFACTTREAIQAVAKAALNPQSIMTPSGEELVFVSKRAYDQIKARGGNEDAEDRMTERLVTEARQRIAAGEEDLVRAGSDGRPPRPDAETLGQTVRRLRKEQGRSQQELAAMVEITQGYLSDIEGDRKNPTPETMWKIRAALGMDNPDIGDPDEA